MRWLCRRYPVAIAPHTPATSHSGDDDPDLEVDTDSVLVLRTCGTKSYPGRPEMANLPLSDSHVDMANHHSTGQIRRVE